MVALRAFADLGAGRPRVEMAAGDAVKRGLATFALEPRVVAAVIVKPQAEEYRRDEQAIDDNRGGQGEHGPILAEMSGRAKRRMAGDFSEAAFCGWSAASPTRSKTRPEAAFHL